MEQRKFILKCLNWRESDMEIFEIGNCDYQIELKYKNNLALIIVNDNQKPKNKYAIFKIGEQSKNLILQTKFERRSDVMVGFARCEKWR